MGRPKPKALSSEERFNFFLGLTLGHIRERAGLSRESIASLLETTSKSVSDWETGKNRPDNLEYVLQAYAYAAGYPPNGKEPDGRYILRDAAEAFVRFGAAAPFEPPKEHRLDSKPLMNELGTAVKRRLKET